MLKRWLNTDKISLGLILGVIIPVPFALLFAAILRLIQTNFHMLSRVRDADMLLLGLAVNLIVMRYYLVKLKFEKTGKALLVLTVFMILMFFIFLKNSNFVLPF
jgi:hypothetical protein